MLDHGIFECAYNFEDLTNTFGEVSISEKIGEKKSQLKMGLLGKWSGPHAVLNGLSRNKRFYPEALWERVIRADYFKKKMETNMMIGTIGHDLEITETELRDGRVSHYTNNFEINPNSIGDEGIGPVRLLEADSFILSTPVGRRLYDYLSADMKLYTSSRGDGVYEKDNMVNGMPVMDPKKYTVERWDVVMNPGFLLAQPKLEGISDESFEKIRTENKKYFIIAESFNEDQKIVTKGATMSEAKTATLAEEATRDLLEANKKLQENNMELAKYQVLGTLTELSEAKDYFKDNSEVIKSIKELGSVVSIKEVFNKFEEATTKLGATDKFIKEFGSFEVIEKVCTDVATFVEECGTFVDVKKYLDTSEAWLEGNGSFAEITKSLLASIEFHKEYGTEEDIKEVFEKLESKEIDPTFEKYGTNDDIKFMFETYGSQKVISEVLRKVSKYLDDPDKLSEGLDEIEHRVKAVGITESTGIDQEKVLEKVRKGWDETEIRAYYNKTSTLNGARFLPTPKTPVKENTSNKVNTIKNESRITRSLNSLTKI